MGTTFLGLQIMSTDNFTCAGDWWKGALMEFTTSGVYTWASAVVSAVAVLSSGGNEHAAMINEPFVNGIVLAALMYISIDVSGGHVNPIFSFAQLVGKQINVVRFLVYLVFQILGAFAGGLFAWASTGTGGLRNPANLGAKTDVPDVHNNEDYNVGNAFILDIVLTIFIGYVYQVVMVDKRDLFTAVDAPKAGAAVVPSDYSYESSSSSYFDF